MTTEFAAKTHPYQVWRWSKYRKVWQVHAFKWLSEAKAYHDQNPNGRKLVDALAVPFLIHDGKAYCTRKWHHVDASVTLHPFTPYLSPPA